MNTLAKFYKFYLQYRVACVAVLFAVTCIQAYSFTFDVEVRGPEHERLDAACRDKENREAAERVNSGESDDRKDVERANQYERDNGV